MNRFVSLCALCFILFFIAFQGRPQGINRHMVPTQYPLSARVYDSVMAMQVPVLEVPAQRLKTTLPSSVDNSQNEFWPGLLDQYQFYSCQQYAGVAYTFGYEYNRMRNQPGCIRAPQIDSMMSSAHSRSVNMKNTGDMIPRSWANVP